MCSYSIYISGYFPYTFLAFIIPAMLLIVLCLLVLISVMVCVRPAAPRGVTLSRLLRGQDSRYQLR